MATEKTSSSSTLAVSKSTDGSCCGVGASSCSETMTSLWTRLKSIKWKNNPPPTNKAYQPTFPEHLANILTHGLYLVPVIYWCYHDLLVHRSHPDSNKAWACFVYGLVTIGLFSVSTLFHIIFCLQGDCSLLKALFHRFDRAMIYIFIAGSYTPWLTLKKLPADGWGAYFRWAIWPFASIGILYQQLFHEKFKLLETTFYLMIGLLPSLVVWEMVDDIGMSELKTGGVIYLFGVIFFKLDGRVPFAHAIWHLHVVAASTVHYNAVIRYLVNNNNSTHHLHQQEFHL